MQTLSPAPIAIPTLTFDEIQHCIEEASAFATDAGICELVKTNSDTLTLTDTEGVLQFFRKDNLSIQNIASCVWLRDSDGHEHQIQLFAPVTPRALLQSSDPKFSVNTPINLRTSTMVWCSTGDLDPQDLRIFEQGKGFCYLRNECSYLVSIYHEDFESQLEEFQSEGLSLKALALLILAATQKADYLRIDADEPPVFVTESADSRSVTTST